MGPFSTPVPRYYAYSILNPVRMKEGPSHMVVLKNEVDIRLHRVSRNDADMNPFIFVPTHFRPKHSFYANFER